MYFMNGVSEISCFKMNNSNASKPVLQGQVLQTELVYLHIKNCLHVFQEHQRQLKLAEEEAARKEDERRAREEEKKTAEAVKKHNNNVLTSNTSLNSSQAAGGAKPKTNLNSTFNKDDNPDS